MPTPAPSGSGGPTHDLLALIAILSAGCVLALAGGTPTGDLAGYVTSLAGLYAAWRHRR